MPFVAECGGSETELSLEQRFEHEVAVDRRWVNPVEQERDGVQRNEDDVLRDVIMLLADPPPSVLVALELLSLLEQLYVSPDVEV